MADRVLIVDDHPAFRAAARQLLVSEGYDVVGEAGDGASALDAVRALRPDVVLLDVQLPDIDGFEVAERLAVEFNGNAPAVLLTSSRDWSDYGRPHGPAHARGFLPKSELSGERIAATLS